MNPLIHTNKKYACLNIIINLVLLSTMVYLVKTNHRKNVQVPSTHKKQETNKDPFIHHVSFPKGDWMENTVSHNIIGGEVLCGIIANNKNYDRLSSNGLHADYNSIYTNHLYRTELLNSYSTDCILFKPTSYITTVNGKFKTLFF
jgi:hypothetical protein